MWIYDFAFCCKFGEMSQIHVFRGAAQIITILHRGVIKIYYNITWGGFPIYYNITMGGGGSLGAPNLYYVIYGRPLIYRKVCKVVFDGSDKAEKVFFL